MCLYWARATAVLMNDQYIHGTDDDEQQRLALMNEIINPACLAELALDAESAVLDVGCGTGQFTRLVARNLGPGAVVVGVENDSRQLKTARALAELEQESHLVRFEFGEAGKLAQAPPGRDKYDLVHCRFLLEHLRDPGAAVADMIRSLRIGGRVVLADDDHAGLRLWPEPPGLAAAWKAYFNSYLDHGNDPLIGRRLVQLLHDSGARPVRNTQLFFGSCAGHRNFDAVIVNLLEVMRGAKDSVVAGGRMTAADYDAGIHEGYAFAQRADAAIWYAICWAEGVRVV